MIKGERGMGKSIEVEKPKCGICKIQFGSAISFLNHLNDDHGLSNAIWLSNPNGMENLFYRIEKPKDVTIPAKNVCKKHSEFLKNFHVVAEEKCIYCVAEKRFS